MINVFELYEDVQDKINEPSNGQLTFPRFNRFLWLAQLRMLDWLSGDVSNIVPPTPYSTEKDRAWLSLFIKKMPVQVKSGLVDKPEDYYVWDNGYLLGNYNAQSSCEEDAPATGCNIPIELLSNDEFYYRCNTDIEGLQPSFTKPVAKEIGSQFEFLPTDLGSVTLEYIRYPIKARIGTIFNEKYHEDVYDQASSENLEWNPYAQDILAWFVADMFFNFVSNQSGKGNNLQTGKTVRDAR